MVVNEVRVPPVVRTRVAAAVVVENPMRKLSIFMLLLFLFLTHSRLLEVVYIPSLALVLAILAMMGATLGGDMSGAVKSRVGALLIGFTIWAFLTVPFSVWPGGSVGLLKDTWLKNVMVFYMIGAVLLTAVDCRKAFKIMAFGTALMVLLSFKYANMSSGRLAFGEGTLGNPNDFAAYLLVGAAFCVYGLMRSGMFMRVFWGGILLVLMMQFLQTGSRGGLIALAVLVLYLVWKAFVTTKAMMIAALVGAIAAAPVILPRSVLERYATLRGCETYCVNNVLR